MLHDIHVDTKSIKGNRQISNNVLIIIFDPLQVSLPLDWGRILLSANYCIANLLIPFNKLIINVLYIYHKL